VIAMVFYAVSRVLLCDCYGVLGCLGCCCVIAGVFYVMFWVVSRV